MFLCGTAESGYIILTRKVELSFFLLMDIPKDIDTNRIHPQRFAHFDTMVPICLRDTGVMQLGCFHHKWFAVEQECILTSLELAGSSLCLCTTKNNDCKKYQ